jgi:hypothetical protein
MSREFSLVLLGAGALTAGYLLAPSGDEAMEERADAVAAQQTGHAPGTTGSHRTGHSHFFFVHTGGYAGYGTPPGRSAASPGVSRGGFGAGGHAAGGGTAAS